VLRFRIAALGWHVAALVLATQGWSAATAEPHSRREFVAFARAHAPRVEARQAERDQADAEARTRGFWLPEPPQVGGEWTHRRPGEGSEFHDRVFDASLALEPFGQGIFRARAAGAERHRTRMEVDARARTWAADVAWRYCEYQRWRWMQHQTALQSEVTRALTETVHNRWTAGDVSGLEVDLARVEGAEARLRELDTAQFLRRAEESLAAAIGWPAEAALPAPDSLELVPAFPDTAGLLARALEARPDLLVARAALEQARAAAKLAGAELFPGAEVGVFGGHEEGDEVRGLRAGLTLPFLGPPLAARGARTAEQRRLDAELRGAQRDAAAEIIAARDAMALEFEAVSLYQRQILPGIQDARRRYQEAYALGEVDLTIVLLSEQRYRAAERSFAEALGAYVDALRELEVATGLPVLSGYNVAEEVEP
jgi:outer membrane protein TolC